ncbi:MAG: septal ring lytic transglycosylase RlpA family protein [Alphaproteobacteria bacterium]
MVEGRGAAAADSRGAWRVRLALGFAVLALAGCSAKQSPRPPSGTGPVTGVASWYGPGFHGKATTSGEIYDQEAMTAAHPTWPLGTRVRVTNLDNGRQTVVRVNDRGPFVGGRAIDLSRAAARKLDMLGPGTCRVRLEPLLAPGESLEVRFAVQVAAFDEESEARSYRRRLLAREAPKPGVYVVAADSPRGTVWRVRVGPFRERQAAEGAAKDLAGDGGRPVVVEESPAAGGI